MQKLAAAHRAFTRLHRPHQPAASRFSAFHERRLLRNERRTVGRIDARFLGIDRDAAGDEPEFDPSIAAIIGPYSGMLNDYVSQRSEIPTAICPTEVLTARVRPWNYEPYENRYVNVAETLRKAMTQKSVSGTCL